MGVDLRRKFHVVGQLAKQSASLPKAAKLQFISFLTELCHVNAVQGFKSDDAIQAITNDT